MSSNKFKITEYQIYLTDSDIIDVRILHIKKEFIGFVLNYRAEINGEWHQIYRVDTCHGYLHEQRFWMSNKPIALKGYDTLNLNELFVLFRRKIKNNFKRYKEYYEIQNR